MFESLQKGVEAGIADKADLVQIRGQKRRMVTCTVKNGIIENFSDIRLSGIGVRVYVDGNSWGFTSTNALDSKSVEKALVNATKLGKASSILKSRRTPLKPRETVEAEISSKPKKSPDDLSPKDILEIPSSAFRGAKEADPRIADVKATYISIQDDKYFVCSEGSRIHQETTRILLFVNVLAKRNGMLCPASENLGHTGGLEMFDKVTPHSLGKTVAEKAARLLKSKPPPPGKFRVVIHPTLCATLLHEAIGHPLEADLAMAGGGFGKRIGELVSSPLVTIYDDGQVQGGLGYFPFDDEGVESKRTNLIESGVLKSFMHDRTSATKAEALPTGNAHAWDYSVEPLIRQTNIGIEVGESSVEEMIEDVNEGLFLEGTFGGQADVNADFTFGFQSARQIEQGRLGEELRGANVAGNAIEVFKTIDAVGKEAILRPGACGKQQFAVQGRLVPAIRCEILVGGMEGK